MKMLKSILSALLAITMLLSCSVLLTGCVETETPPMELSPEAHLMTVWEQSLWEAVDSLSALRNKINDDTLSAPEKTGMCVQLNINDIILDNMANSMGLEGDLSFLSNIKLDVYTDTAGETEKLQMLVSLQGEKLITLNVLVNLTQYLFYVGAPELNDTYLKIEAGNLINSLVGVIPTQQQLSDMVKALPDKVTLTSLVTRYSRIILGYIKNVERSAVTLEAEGVSQKVTGLSLSFKEKDTIELEKELLTTLKNDAEFKAVFDAFYGAACTDGPESAYNDFQKTVQEKLDALNEQYEYSTAPMTFTTYVDKTDKIIGIRFATQEDSTENALYFYNLTDGDKIATLAALERENHESFRFSGSGNILNGKLSGEYKFYGNDGENDVDYLKISVKDLDEQGATVNLKPTAEMLAALGMNANFSLFTYQLHFDLSSFGLSVVNDGTNLFEINVSVGDGMDLDFEVPENAVNVTDQEKIDEWLSNTDTDTLIAKLREMGAGPLLDRIKEMM